MVVFESINNDKFTLFIKDGGLKLGELDLGFN
jgi:hypothetical protein